MIKKSILILFMMGFAASHAAAAGDFPLSDHNFGCQEATYPFTLGQIVAAVMHGGGKASMNRGNDGLYYLTLNFSVGNMRLGLHPQDGVAVAKRMRVISLMGANEESVSGMQCEMLGDTFRGIIKAADLGSGGGVKADNYED